MLDLNFEIISPLTSQERYEIINFALDAANDNGFLSQYVFEQALWCKVATYLVDDIEDEIVDMVSRNPMEAWDRMVKEEILQTLFNQYRDLIIETVEGVISYLDYLGNIAAQYYSEYKEYLLSFGGALSQTDMMSSDNLETFTKELQDFMNNDNTLKTLQVADDWGMNNKIDKEEIVQKQKERELKIIDDLPDDSLFK